MYERAVNCRHHSPACARLAKSLIESQRPRYVLIEGPADFNDRIDELFLAHQLPVAIYSYCQYQDGAAPGVVPGRHLLNFRRSGRRYKPHVVFRHKLTSSICLAGRRVKKRTIRLIHKMKARPYCCVTPAWITAIPCGITYSKMKASKLHYPLHWRAILPNCGRFPEMLNRQREAFMARWITWAMQQNNGDVLVVCGGWHAPALANMWRECPQEINKPELSSLADAVTGCYLTPYSEKRLDVLAGYLSGMPAPVWQNWCWQCGLQQAGEQLLKTVLTRLRQHKLPASTADMAAAHLHAMALAQLRGHTLPLRTDWLDAIAGSLIKEALNAPLPWSYRGVIHPDTDPILVTLIDTLAGDGFGKLAPSTPQPPLPKDVTCELERTGISLPAELTLNRFTPMDWRKVRCYIGWQYWRSQGLCASREVHRHLQATVKNAGN